MQHLRLPKAAVVALVLMLVSGATPGPTVDFNGRATAFETASRAGRPPVLAGTAAGLAPHAYASGVDWAAAIRTGQIAPRADLAGTEDQLVMDLDLVIPVAGGIGDVLFSHKSHTQWLACTNCHEAIFEPERGSNPMSMSRIVAGLDCGICHGRVAFPVDDCMRCHSAHKPAAKVGE